MIELQGKYNKGIMYAETFNSETIKQIIELLNQEYLKDSKIRIMPDCHYSKGATVGTTITYDNKLPPSVVGSDLGCGLLVTKIGDTKIDFNYLDKVNKEEKDYSFDNLLKGKSSIIDNIRFKLSDENKSDVLKSIGKLGGGNHFIEIGKGETGTYLIIHSGSREMGKIVYDYYLNEAKNLNRDDVKNKEISYLDNQLMNDYINDLNIAQKLAEENRKLIRDKIVSQLKLKVIEDYTVVHNYVDTKNKVIRKGAISAYKNEKVAIPLNMKDGTILGVGKGNKDWNYSAPHGSGREFSRSETKELVEESEFINVMEGIYSSGINKSNLDESPFAYKNSQEIISQISDTVEIYDIIKPIYNYKTH